MATTLELRMAQRFCGPPGMTNGGFGCGSLAALLGGVVEVTLRRPVPLERTLTVHPDDGGLTLNDGDTVVAEARPSIDEVTLAVPTTVTAEQAYAVAGSAHYYTDPVFPNCFVCGPDRDPADGLRIFPGRIEATTTLAAPWTPDASVAGPDGVTRPEVVWAALDCPSGMAAVENTEMAAATTAVLARMTARITALPRTGDECVVISWPLRHDGRKLTAGSALIGPNGRVLATAKALWMTISRPDMTTTNSTTT